jgi:type IV secretion system protein VirB5
VRAALLAESALSNAQLAALPPQGVTQLQSRRQSAALLLGLTHEALANASGRFAALQQLIDAIGHASDPKAALDLQARISAEAGMLQNEGTKLQVLFQTVHADEQADTQRTRELTIAGHGAFAGRFQPHP